MRVKVLGPNLHGVTETFHVHAADCADIKRDPKRHGYDQSTPAEEAKSKIDIVDSVYPPSDFECESGEYIYDFHFFPCTEGLA